MLKTAACAIPQAPTARDAATVLRASTDKACNEGITARVALEASSNG